jgi:hypothetical protein
VVVNPVTNKIYVVNSSDRTVTVIDGATNDTTSVPAGDPGYALAVNPVTNKIYVTNSDHVTIIDGATNDTASALVDYGYEPTHIVVNPVTNKTYMVHALGLAEITDAPANDTKVRAAFNHLSGDTTSLGRPFLTGKGVNRSSPDRTAMMGISNLVGTIQKAWSWANIISGAGTDSVTWSYNWGADSLILGENFVCAVPLEAQAATTNNLGLGSPFAGNLEVYPVYRIGLASGVEESHNPQATGLKLGPTIIRGVLVLPASPRLRVPPSTALLDISGREVMSLRPGANDVSRLSPGVYFVGEAQAQAQAQAVRKVVVTR